MTSSIYLPMRNAMDKITHQQMLDRIRRIRLIFKSKKSMIQTSVLLNKSTIKHLKKDHRAASNSSSNGIAKMEVKHTSTHRRVMNQANRWPLNKVRVKTWSERGHYRSVIYKNNLMKMISNLHIKVASKSKSWNDLNKISWV